MNTQLKLALIVGFSGTVCMIDLWATDVSSADVALNRLVEGNRRFVSGTVTHPDQSVERRTELASGQSPFAIVLACADSRVSPELIFDQGLGDIFVLRNAGNLIDEHTIGSIEYAVEHLHSRLIVVLGHTKCGAVGAAVVGGHAAGRIPSIVEMIAPSVAEAQKLGGDVAAKAVELNARRMAGILRQVQPVLSKEVAAGNLKIVSGCLDITTGQVKITE